MYEEGAAQHLPPAAPSEEGAAQHRGARSNAVASPAVAFIAHEGLGEGGRCRLGAERDRGGGEGGARRGLGAAAGELDARIERVDPHQRRQQVPANQRRDMDALQKPLRRAQRARAGTGKGGRPRSSLWGKGERGRLRRAG